MHLQKKLSILKVLIKKGIFLVFNKSFNKLLFVIIAISFSFCLITHFNFDNR